MEAKLVTGSGLAISVETEFICNSDGKTKQDCELNAFYGMAKRLKKRFPQLRICLLLDSLYAAAPVMDILKEYKWKYITTFKEGLNALKDMKSSVILKNFVRKMK
ncbi:MAG: hypothetical protein ACYCXB_09940 [Candidatus Humimicrobiaceae bacterium]